MNFLTYDQHSRMARGMKSLVSVAKKLSSSGENPGLHEEMQEDARCAWEEMAGLENDLAKQKRNADYQYVRLTDKKSHLTNQMKERKLMQDLLQTQMSYHERTSEQAREIVTRAQEHLSKLTELQKKVRQEEKWQNVARNIALLFMPFSTLMAGIVAAIFQTAVYTSQRADKELQKAIHLYETRVCEYEQHICECDAQKGETERKIKADEIKMAEIQEKLSDLENVTEKQQQFLSPLGLLVVDLKVLKATQQNDYRSAWKRLESVVEHLDQDLLNFLNSQEITGFVGDLKRIIQSRADV